MNATAVRKAIPGIQGVRLPSFGTPASRNAQDVDIFRQRHKPDAVRWPGQPEPTRGIKDHNAESIAFSKTSLS